MPVQNQKEYQRQWIAKRRQDWFADKYCVICSSVENLELDHVDSSLKISHKIWSWSEERRNKELAKCQVLCHTHHLKKTLSLFPPRQHGTQLMYLKSACRCSECKEAHSVCAKEYRKKNKKK